MRRKALALWVPLVASPIRPCVSSLWSCQLVAWSRSSLIKLPGAVGRGRSHSMVCVGGRSLFIRSAPSRATAAINDYRNCVTLPTIPLLTYLTAHSLGHISLACAYSELLANRKAVGGFPVGLAWRPSVIVHVCLTRGNANTM